MLWTVRRYQAVLVFSPAKFRNNNLIQKKIGQFNSKHWNFWANNTKHQTPVRPSDYDFSNTNNC